MLKFVAMLATVVGITCVSTSAQAYDGDCPDSGWSSYMAGNVPLLIRSCQRNGMTFLDVKNTSGFDICLDTYGNESRWLSWPLSAGDFMTRSKTGHVTWRLAARRKNGPC